MIRKILSITLSTSFLVISLYCTKAMEDSSILKNNILEEPENLSQKEKNRLIYNRWILEQASKKHNENTGEVVPEDVLNEISNAELALAEKNTFTCPKAEDVLTALKEKLKHGETLTKEDNWGQKYTSAKVDIGGLEFSISGGLIKGDLKSIELTSVSLPFNNYSKYHILIEEGTGQCEYNIDSAVKSDLNNNIEKFSTQISLSPIIDKNKYYIITNFGRDKNNSLRIGTEIMNSDEVIFKIIKKPAGFKPDK